MSRRIHEVAYVWLSDVTTAWFYARERGDYYPMCRGRRHRGPNAGWAPPVWNLRWHYRSHSVRGQATSQYWCDACLPAKYRQAARQMALLKKRSIKVDSNGVPITPNDDWGSQFVCPVHGRRDNDTVTSMKTCAVPKRGGTHGFCNRILKRT